MINIDKTLTQSQQIVGVNGKADDLRNPSSRRRSGLQMRLSNAFTTSGGLITSFVLQFNSRFGAAPSFHR
jgi:hypothetical protein